MQIALIAVLFSFLYGPLSRLDDHFKFAFVYLADKEHEYHHIKERTTLLSIGTGTLIEKKLSALFMGTFAPTIKEQKVSIGYQDVYH